MQGGLKNIAKTGDNDGYAFSQLKMPEKELRKLFELGNVFNSRLKH